MTTKTRRQQIQEMLAQDPQDPFLRYGLAMEYVSEGNDEGAVSCFQDLVVSNPDYVPAYMQTAQALLRLSRQAEAKDILLRGAAEARKHGDLHAAEEMAGLLAGL